MFEDDSEHQPLLSGEPESSHNTFGRSRRPSIPVHEQSQSQFQSQLERSPGNSPSNGRDEDGPHRERWREWVGERLESPRTHKIVLTLIAIDACCVLADLVYTFLSPDRDCANLSLSSSSLSSRPQPHWKLDSRPRIGFRILEEEGDPTWLTVLAHISLVINAFFVLEIPLAVWCFGYRYYMPFRLSRHSGAEDDESTRVNTDADVESQEPSALPRRTASVRKAVEEKKKGSEVQPYAALHLFDAAVVLATFVLEVVLRGRERELAGLLVLLRLWRLVKLVGGIAVGAGEMQEELSQELEDKEEQLVGARQRIAELETELAKLRPGNEL